jgi:molecular chaperone DnaK
VERMVADAEAHRGEDSRLRELADARNELDSAAYQVERLLAERGEGVAEHDRARAEMLLGEARQAIKETETPLERLRSMVGELRQLAQALTMTPAGGPTGPGGGSGPDDDVVDAEFETS